MAQVLIRNLDDDVFARLKARAAEREKSLEAHLRDVLAEAAGPTKAQLLEIARRIREMSPPLPPGSPTAEELIREDRDTR